MLALSDLFWNCYRWGLRLLRPSHPVSLASRAEEALAQQQWGRAFDLSHLALRRQQDFAPALLLRALSRLHLDDNDGALHDLHRFLALVEEPPAIVYYWRGWIYGHKGDWAMALASFERALTLAPDDPPLHYWRAYALWQREEWGRMDTALTRLEALDPDSPLVWELRGHHLMHQGALEAAVRAYTRALEEGWENLDLRYHRAVAHRQLGQHEAARADIEAILQADPANPWAYLEMSHAAFVAGHYPEALQQARTAIALEPELFEAHVCEVATWLAMGERAVAHERLMAMRGAFPDEPLVEQLCGDLLAEEGESAGAVRCYRRALEHEPDNHTLRVKLASELIALEAYAKAEAELAQVLGDDPAFEEAYATRADLHRCTNQPAAMRADLDHLLTLNPQHAWALAFRAAHRQWQGDVAGALADYGAALALDPHEGWIWAFRGQFHLRAGRLEAAREDFQQAITLSPEDGWIRRQWADLLFRCGYPERAAEVLDCLIADEPEDGFARLFRAELHLLVEAWDAARAQLEALVASGHELAWLAHAVLAVLADGERSAHLAQAVVQCPEPTYWGVTPAIVLAQRALVAWLCEEPDEALTQLREALAQLEPGELPWLALRPLLVRLGAAPLVALLPEPAGVLPSYAP